MTVSKGLSDNGTSGTTGTEVAESSTQKSAQSGTAEILLDRGLVTVVDADMLEFLSQWKWRVLITARGGPYAVRHEKGKPYYMHRVIMDAPKGMVVDHIDGNPLNNTRANMRLCKQGQNAMSRRPNKRTRTSVYKGVSWDKKAKKWQASIGFNYQTIRVGWFDSEREAAKAYNRAARKLHGEFARLNKLLKAQ